MILRITNKKYNKTLFIKQSFIINLFYAFTKDSMTFLDFFYQKRYNKNMKKLIVNQKYHEKRLNKFLLENIPNLSSNLFYKTLRKKDIKINGKRVCENITVYDKDEILVYIADDLLLPSFQLDLVFEDTNILILNKPAGLEVTGKNSLTTQIHLKYKDSNFKPMPCHRIDRNTTGLVLFAKNEETLVLLLNKFKKREIEKHYLALVYGTPKDNNKKNQAYLFKDNKKACVYISDAFKKGYKKIITTYHVLEKYANHTSLLDVEIETGKTHQIRAHLAHLGYPIIGDRKVWYQSNKQTIW